MKSKGSGVICVSCGKEPSSDDVKGSLKHPYCKKCFKKIFNNNYNKYDEFLIYEHG